MSLIDDISKRLGSMLRSDNWVNPFTGFGTSRDKTAHSHYFWDQTLSDDEVSSLYHTSDTAGKIVDKLPEEALRLGLTIDGPQSAKVNALFDKLDARDVFLDGWRWGRAFGGAAVLLGVDDGQDVRKPLDERRVKAFDFLEVYDKRRCWPIDWYLDPQDPRYGRPKIYQLQALKGGTSEVHESRLLLFGGQKTADFEKLHLNFWDYSILQRCYGPLRQFETLYKAAEILLSDASTGVFKMHGLLANIAAPNGQQNLATRAQLLDMGRSAARSIFLDADSQEEFEKIATQFSGIPDMLDRAANRLAAAADMPVTILMGRSPAGLNATGESDIRSWYASVAAQQSNYAEPRVNRLIRLACYALGIRERHKVKWESLWQPTEKEIAETRKIVAETDQIYVHSQILAPEEVAENRFGRGEYSSETKISTLGRTPVPPPEPARVPGYRVPPQGYAKNPIAGPGSNNQTAPVDQGPKPGGGRFPHEPGPTVGNPWPAPPPHNSKEEGEE